MLDSDDYDFRYDCGVRQPTTMMTINDRDDIVSALAMQTVFSIKAEMDQMIAGLNDYGLGELARNNSEVLRQLFVHYRQLPLTSDTLYDMFAPQLSSSGSNIRNEEEAALMHWVYYTRDVQGIQFEEKGCLIVGWDILRLIRSVQFCIMLLLAMVIQVLAIEFITLSPFYIEVVTLAL